MLDLSHVTPVRYTMAEAVAAVQDHLERLRAARFRELVADCDERIQVGALPGALELYREGKVDLEQADTFGRSRFGWGGAA